MCFYIIQVTLVLQAFMAIQDQKVTRVKMGSPDHLVKKEKEVVGITGNHSLSFVYALY